MAVNPRMDLFLKVAAKGLSVVYAFLLALACLASKVYKHFVNLEGAKKSVAGDVLVITGGGSGIGRLVALRMADLGATVVTLDVNEAENNRTVEMIKAKGMKGQGFKCDLMNREEVYKVCQQVRETVGDVSLLINNAGIVGGATFLNLSDDKIEAAFRVNAVSQFWTIKSFLPRMIENKKGHIVTVASVAAFAGLPKMSEYCASKSALLSMFESLSYELYSAGQDLFIKTTVVCPYMIDTGMFKGAKSEVLVPLQPEFVADQIVQAILLEEEFLVLPRWLWAMYIVKTLLPVKALMYLNEAFGLGSLMDGFVGRGS